MLKWPLLLTIVNTSKEYDQLEEFAAKLNMPFYALEEAITSGQIKCSINEGQFYLKRNANYYIKFQGQLHISQ